MTSYPATPDSLPHDRLTERELSRHWRCSTRTLQRLRETGRGPAWLRIGGRVLYMRSAVLAFEMRCEHGGDAK